MINVPPPDHTDHTLDALLMEALDSAAADPTRLALVTRLFLLTADLDRAADLDRMTRDGAPPVFWSWPDK